ncbi:hypothetical protein BN7_858 [Wickerhamomyces ciferrii]|uniref:Non-specific serine/threonine protein kinase n=1 Tax=Wickerhamomyces ciferrii (strain ATCC 14091 / BCRC 22168 / CBS 111 / JCM 3599 / NBRC 0793 / NRRL Y-1031 F-60-10) TaxID=1206466 RepID=K0KIT4_WICCF|nr:uncharacterized protein BN7_858 [Wickerhamomyces ciferrii]CCH41319.1 hypothetical protein BN7_858 [Wickerhamomyces ciferrii]
MSVFTLDEEEETLHNDFQDRFSISEPLDIPHRRRKSSTASNRNTPSHRLGTSVEIGLEKSYISSYASESEIPINDNLSKSPVKVTVTSDVKSGKPKPSDFEYIKVLGVGSYGKVLLVREKKTGKLFAQKQLKKASIIIQSKTVERTINEKSILENIDHGSIVKLFYSFQDNDKLYLILEYLDGGELFQHLQQEKFLSETNAAVYLAQMVLGLEHLHKIGIVYRDLKPENCLLDSDGYLVLTDFGLSKVGLNDDELCTSLIGTPEYMAPEILQDIPYDYAVDFWSLGCVMFDMLTGSPPFTGNNNKRIMDKILANKFKVPFYLSADAKDLLLRLLKKNPDKRLTDFETVKKHRFFRKINWSDIENRSFIPPIVPIITDPILAENFDNEFTEMSITPVGSPMNGMIIKQSNGTIDNDPFKGFSYTDKGYSHIYT